MESTLAWTAAPFISENPFLITFILTQVGLFFALHFVIFHIYIFGRFFGIDFPDKKVVVIDQSPSIMGPASEKYTF